MARYKIRSPQIVHQTIDGEAVLLNLERGHYYSLRFTAEAIWSGILKGLSESGVVSVLERSFDADAGEIEKAVADFILKLKAEELILPLESNGHDALNTAANENGKPDKIKFEAPVLEKYTDMEELLLLDPIHEVDEAGWPNAQKAQSHTDLIHDR